MSRLSKFAGAAVAGVLTAAAALAIATAGPADAAVTAGCAKAPTLTSGTRTISSGGQNRSYILRVPDNYDRNHPYKLIFAFHWLNGTAANVQSNGYYGLQNLSNNSAIFVAPQGIDNGWANTGNRDLTLVDNLTSLIEGDLCVDTTQLFALGWSYGGSMSYAVACARPTVFRAVAVLSGANLSGCSPGNQPVAYLGIHGIHDSVLNISLGRSIRDTFVRNNGCTAQNPPEPAQGSLTHIATTYSGCRAGYPVEWAAFDGDHTPEPVDGSTQTNPARTWVGGEIWRFFSQLTSTTSPSPSSPTPTPTTPTPTTPAPSPTTPPPGACSAGYRITGQWQGGFQAEVTVTAGATALNGWRVGWTFADGQTVSQIWGGRNTASGSTQTVTNETYNGTLGAGAATTFGFLGTWNGTNSVPAVTCAAA
ncbi:cellulose binding domain-containing protein [Actinoplanes sp. N902-109]|uniref:cellulose binding domain-containing protein n=1 Tax=Actinoplanes sp. (strain N902-109) TaxID=649831 RepID=UPI0003295924|nr:cellulose binding domain-containing protein [Actinoplanes sp. N902-109]AGL16788.1 cellulose-binding family II [Actinoplanes sp. N902-109]